VRAAARLVASPAAAEGMLVQGATRPVSWRHRACGFCRAWLVVDVTYAEAKNAVTVLALAAVCTLFDVGTAIMLLVLGAVLASCFIDRLGFIRLLAGLAVVIGGAWYGYERLPFLSEDGKAPVQHVTQSDRVADALVLPFVLATLTGTPRIPGDTWTRCARRCPYGPGCPLIVVAGLFLGVGAALGYAQRKDFADAFQYAFCAMGLLVFHFICNAFRDTAHSASFAEAHPVARPRTPPRQTLAWQAAAAKMPRSEVLEEDLHGSTASSTNVPRCTVCIEEFKAGEVRLTLPCFHGFHPECVETWIQENGRCPVCRHSILDNEATDENA